MTDALSCVEIEAMRFGSAARAFHAAQHGSTAFEDAVAEMILAQELPDVLRTFLINYRDEDERHLVAFRSVPSFGPTSLRALILLPVDEFVGAYPGHHRPQPRADFLDRMRGRLRPHRLERRLVDLVFEHPIAGETARLNVA